MTTLLQQIEPDVLNPIFERRTPVQIVEWACREFANDMVMSSSFGAESAVMIHMIQQFAPRIRIIFVDTGYLFPETHTFMEQLRLRFDLNVWTYRTRNDPMTYLRNAGETDPSRRNDVDACCAANKNEPFARAMRELAPKAWLRGIRSDQTAFRKAENFIEWSKRDHCWAISPLLRINRRDIHEYLKKHDLPFHPLNDMGYRSIGCYPCTRPVGENDDPRSGRWAGQDKIECGINVTKNSLDSANL